MYLGVYLGAYVPLVVLCLEPRVGELDGGRLERAARRGVAEEDGEVDVGVAAEECSVGEAESGRVLRRRLREDLADLQAEHVQFGGRGREVDAKQTARASDVDVERTVRRREQLRRPPLGHRQLVLVRPLQRVDVLADLQMAWRVNG